LILEHTQRANEKRTLSKRDKQTIDGGNNKANWKWKRKKAKNVATNTELHGPQPGAQGCISGKKVARIKVIEQSIKL